MRRRCCWCCPEHCLGAGGLDQGKLHIVVSFCRKLSKDVRGYVQKCVDKGKEINLTSAINKDTITRGLRFMRCLGVHFEERMVFVNCLAWLDYFLIQQCLCINTAAGTHWQLATGVWWARARCGRGFRRCSTA